MRSIASTARTLSGCAVGELLAYLSWNSAAPLAIQGIAIVALAAVPASSRVRRVVRSVIAIPPIGLVRRLRGRLSRPLRPLGSSWADAGRPASSVALSNRREAVHGAAQGRM